MIPRIKPYSQIVETAAMLFDMPVFEAEEEMEERLEALGIPKVAITIYVNFASHNVLTYLELAEETGLTEATIKMHLQTVKRKFPHLFLGATPTSKR